MLSSDGHCTAGRPTLRWIAALLALPLALVSISCGRETAVDSVSTVAEADGPPIASVRNVVLVTLDTFRADRIGALGGDVRTPNLDRLAAEGTLFTNAQTTVPFTFPAHSSIMTGTYPPFHGVRENVGYYLSDQNRTLAETFSEAGYDTAGFVSAFVLDARWGIARGFGHYYDDFDLGAFENPNLGSVQRPGTDTIAAALDWFDKRSDPDRPFFVWLHLFDAHDPYTPPAPFASQYPGRPYDAEIAYTDALVGRFIDDLQERGLLAETALVVTSDHGEGLGDHGELFHGLFVYESTVHVPLIVRLPRGRAPEALRSALPVSHVDIAPTLLELTGQEVGEAMQGRSLVPDLRGSAKEAMAERAVYAESFYPLLHYGWSPLRVLRSAAAKLIAAPEPELYRPNEDPGEKRNLFEDGPEGAALLVELEALASEIEQGAVGAEAADLDPQALAQLQALGYVAGPGEVAASSWDPSVPRPDPKTKVHLHRGIMLAQGKVSEGRDEEATALLERALAEDPALIDGHQLLGEVALRQENPEAAMRHYQRALELDSGHRPSLFGLASCHRAQGRIDDALLGFRRILDIAGQDSKASLAIADLEVERGNLDVAREALVAAAREGVPAAIWNRLGEVQALSERPEAAKRSFARALEAKPELSQPHFNLGVLAEEAGDAEGARRAYEAAIARAPKHYQAQFNLARLEGALGQKARERALLEQAIASKPDFAVGYFFLGKALMEAGELERAEEAARKGLELRDDIQLGWYVLSDILNRSGRQAEAAEAVERGRSIAG